MDGLILAISPTEKAAKKVWQTVFLKLDDISAKLVAFTDRSQFCVLWSLPLAAADVATPIPGEPNHGVNVEDTQFCFCVRNAAGTACHYFAAPSDDAKKQWMKALLRCAREGPQSPRFATPVAQNEFSFQARVVKFRTHESGKHAEYMIMCSCQLFSKVAARRISKTWEVWHRFSEFDALHEALKTSLGAQLDGIEFVKYRSDALRSLWGGALDHDFLEQRRLQLDTYVTRVCALGRAVDFFKHHADANLNKFFLFDENCQSANESPRKSKGSRAKDAKTSRHSSRSSADSEASGRDSVSSVASSEAFHTPRERQSSGDARERKVSSPSSSAAADKRERRASKKKDKSRQKAALASGHEIDPVRSASPTGAH